MPPLHKPTRPLQRSQPSGSCPEGPQTSASSALDAVAARLTGDQLIRQVLQGGGNMPAYAKQLSPPEVTALVAWMETLHPSWEPPALDKTWKRKAP